LAIARAVSQLPQSLSVGVFERTNQVGQCISARNSGVIHAGLYYPASWQKTQLCVEGAAKLYRYAQAHHIPHQKTGKLVVAKAEQAPELKALWQRAEANGVQDLQWLSKAELAQREPALQADIALFSPHSGIIDVPALCQQLSQDVSEQGALLLLAHQIDAIGYQEAEAYPFELSVSMQDKAHTEPFQLSCKYCINAAGFAAQALAAQCFTSADLNSDDFVPPSYYAAGHYYQYQGQSPFKHLIYPLPEAQGLGIHSSLTLDGHLQFGPDVRFIDRPDYRFDDSHREAFIQAIQQYFPALKPEHLLAGQVGVRPKLSSAGEPLQDFIIQGEKVHGLTGLVNLFGIESPGVTASLAIADAVVDLLDLR